MKPEDLLTVAQDLLDAGGGGPGAPLGARLRRSISASYYAMFHAALDLVATQGTGATADRDAREALRRSVDHRDIADAAQAIQRPKQKQPGDRQWAYYRLADTLQQSGWAPNMADLLDLQRLRQVADYDLSRRTRFKRAEAVLALRQAERTVTFLLGHRTGDEGRRFFVLVTAR